MLFRANPHITLRARQSYRACDTSPLYSPSLQLNLSPASIMRSPPPHLYSPVLPGCTHPGRVATESVNSWRKGLGEPECGIRNPEVRVPQPHLKILGLEPANHSSVTASHGKSDFEFSPITDGNLRLRCIVVAQRKESIQITC